MEELNRFFKSIKFSDEENNFADWKVEKVVVNKKEKKFYVYLKAANILDMEVIDKLLKATENKINDKSDVEIRIMYESITDDDVLRYFKELFSKVINKHPSLASLSNSKIKIKQKDIIIDITNKTEENSIMMEKNKIEKKLEQYGFYNYQIKTFLNEELKEEIKNEIKESSNKPIKVKKEINNIIIGKHIDGEIETIDNILGETRNIIIEAYIFGIDTLERDNINIITLKVSDKTNSILAKIFKRDKDEYFEVLKNLKENEWYRIHGNVDFDNFSKDIVMSIRNLERIKSKDNVSADEEPVKRVELHAHSFMSMMDSVVPQNDLVKYALSLGHKAVAITDHNCLQAYPDLYHAVVSANKSREEKDHFKVLYGAELSVVSDDVDVIFNPQEFNLMNQTYVVFDTETTGFHPGHDQMIEIGAVKIKDGEITERFDELIDPGYPIPKKITELTNITDELVKGKDNEENVTKRFLEWTGDLPMVAHNAKFDISFVKEAMQKYNLGEFKNTVLDTMSLARILNPDWPNHKLQTLVRRYKIEWNESEHHRADYDSEGTAKAFYKMAKILYDRNIETTMDIYNSVDQDALVKFSIPFHITVLAQNKVGLKNLFKLISMANTKYLFKNSQPKLPRKEILKHKEGLLIGSGCVNGEIFEAALTKEDDELSNMMQFYDYIEVQPVSHMLQLLELSSSAFKTKQDLENHLKKIIRVANDAGKIVCATGDVHNLTSEDKIYRDIIVAQKTNGRLHPLNRPGVHVPNMSFKTTKEMLEEFSFLPQEEAYEIVVTNTNKIADIIEEIEVIIETGGVPFSPRIENSKEIVENMVYDKAKSLYGDPLPEIIETRIEQELKGIIGGGFDVIYLIAQKLVKKSNDDGYLVGSRGSVGSSFVATMMGITEVNPLSAHYLCPNCQHSIFEIDGVSLGATYSSGFDLPDMMCPKCNTKMNKDGQDMPFATFLGFNADKVPDIDLNFSGEYQWLAHEYTKELFGIDNVYRAGTIGTVAEKTAFGFVKGYCEDKNIVMRNIEVERLAKGCTGAKRTTGQHPGGIVVIPDYMDVYDFTPFQYPAEDTSSLWRTTHFDYHAIDQDVLKLDILGHDDPTILRMLQDLSGLDVTKVNLGDKDTMRIFTGPEVLGVTKEQINCETGTLGVPEFGTRFVINMLVDTKPKTFSELIKISGLSHGTDVWVGNAQELIRNKICEFKDVIGCRDDIMVYLMYNNVEPIQAFKIMEFVRKGRASKDPETWSEYVKIMQEANIPEWFIESCHKIKYMFPKAHAAAYVMSAFRIAWFKVHKPIYYYASFFSVRSNDFEIESMLKGYDAVKTKIMELQTKGFDATNKDKAIIETLQVALEMLARGFSFKNIDIEKSQANKFVIDEDDKSLILPFKTIDGLGAAAATTIVEEREKKAYYSIEDLQTRGKVNTTTLAKLRALGVLDHLPETSQLSFF